MPNKESHTRCSSREEEKKGTIFFLQCILVGEGCQTKNHILGAPVERRRRRVPYFFSAVYFSRITSPQKSW